MDRQKIEIKSPCSQNFDEMEGTGYKRFCGDCQKHVHNLSDLTREQARALLKENAAAGICVVYTFDAVDRVQFRDDLSARKPSRRQLRGLKRLLAAAAIVPLLGTIAACDPAPDAEIVILEGYEATNEPCELSQQESFKPIDAILEAEEEFTRKFKELLGFGPDETDVEYLTAGAPMIAEEVYDEPVPVDPVEPVIVEVTEVRQVVAPNIEPQPEPEPEVVEVPQPEPPRPTLKRMMMGDFVGAVDDM